MSKLTRIQREILEEMAAGVMIFGSAPPYWLGMRRRVQPRTLETLIVRGWVACEPVGPRREHPITDAGRAVIAEDAS